MNISPTEKNFAELMQHPSEYFGKPQDIIDLALPINKKIDLLEQWKDEILKRQVANEENMLGTDYANLLQALNNALYSLHSEEIAKC